MPKATRQQTKKHNTRLVLKTIYNQDGISRAEIARSTRLTKTTVSSIVAKLMRKGLVEETGLGISDAGKPPILLSVVDDARYYIGIDLANSVFRGATVNLRGEIINRLNQPIHDCDGNAALELVYELIDKLLAASDKPISGIGIGTPGLMDPVNGVVLHAVNLNWTNLPLGKLLAQRYDLPTYIANDSQVAALAEFTFGSNDKSSNLLLIKLGRGVGSGIVINGGLYYGDNYGAGEIGHIVIVQDGEQCRCGNQGCLETLISSRAIIKRAKSIAHNNQKSIINRQLSNSEEIDTTSVLNAYKAGDEDVQLLINETGEILGKAVAHTVSALNINSVVIAGSLSRFGDGLCEPVERSVHSCVLPAIAQATKVVTSELGADIVILGAVSLLLDHELGVV